MVKTSVQYIKEAAKKLVDSKLQRLGSAKTQDIFKGVMQKLLDWNRWRKSICLLLNSI